MSKTCKACGRRGCEPGWAFAVSEWCADWIPKGSLDVWDEKAFYDNASYAVMAEEDGRIFRAINLALCPEGSIMIEGEVRGVPAGFVERKYEA